MHKYLKIFFGFTIITLITIVAFSFNSKKNSGSQPTEHSQALDQNQSEKLEKFREPEIIWMTDFNNNRVLGFTPQGKVVWAQNMSASPIPRSSWYFIGGVERVTIAPNGNLIISYGDGMMVSEINRKNHELVWQYGTAGVQRYRGGKLDEPHKSWKINDHEYLINDSNDREVLVVDQNSNEVVWKYGEYHKIGSAPGILQGNTSVLPINNGEQFLITETLANRIILVDRATKEIVWKYTKPDAKWLENVFQTKNGSFVLSDRQKGEIFAIDREGNMLWDLTKLSDESEIHYPTDTAVLDNGNILIAEAGKSRIVEVIPTTGEVVREYKIHGFVTTIAVDYEWNFNDPEPAKLTENLESQNKTITVDDAEAGMKSGTVAMSTNQKTISGEVLDVNASTGKAGQIAIKANGGTFAVQVYNYSRVLNKNGTPISLMSIQEGDKISVSGTISGGFISSAKVQDNSR